MVPQGPTPLYSRHPGLLLGRGPDTAFSEASLSPPQPHPIDLHRPYSYRSTSAGAILVAFLAGYSVARKLTATARPAIQMASTHCASNGTKLIEYTASSNGIQRYFPAKEHSACPATRPIALPTTPISTPCSRKI